MVSVIVIPILVVAIAGLAGYLVYRYLLAGMSSRRDVNRMLRQYDIDKTPSQIIREYYLLQGKSLSDRDVRDMERSFMRTEPDSFLSMYDEIRAQRGGVSRRRSGPDGGDGPGGAAGGDMGSPADRE